MFPSPDETTGFVSYKEATNGLTYLPEEHPGRLSLSHIGASPGWYNVMDFEVDPQKILVAEVTNDVDDDASVGEKEKVLCSLSIHSDEPAARETGTRVIEVVVIYDEAADDEYVSALESFAGTLGDDGGSGQGVGSLRPPATQANLPRSASTTTPSPSSDRPCCRTRSATVRSGS